jgi:autotransporter-associated beta strand protein
MGDMATGSYTLIQYAGDPLPNLNGLKLSSPGVGGLLATLVNNTSNRSVDVQLAPAPSWNVDSSGSWSDASNWSGPVPSGAGMPARFGPVITAPRTIQNGSRTLGSIVIDSPISYTLTSGSVELRRAGTESPFVRVDSGSHAFSGNLRLHDDTTFTVSRADAQFTVTNVVGPVSITKGGPGTMRISGAGSISGTTTVADGTLLVSGPCTGGSFSVASGATLGGTGSISSVVLLAPSAQIAPGRTGSALTTLTVGGLLLNDSLLEFDLTGGVAEKIVVTDPDQLLLRGTSSIEISFSGAAAEGAFPLIDYSGEVIPDMGHLALNMPFGSGVPALLSYNSSNTSIDLRLGEAFVPEPAMLLGLLVCVGVRTRRCC